MLFRSNSAVLVGVLALGCSQMLGIDGTYVLHESTGGNVSSSGGSPLESGGSGDGGGTGDTGGTGSGGTGGTVDTGGTSGETGGAPGSGASPEAGAGCQPGHYTGSLTGAHRPSVTFVGVPATVKTGTIEFDLVRKGTGLAIQLGVIDAKLTNAVVQDAGSLSATLSGSLDCNTRSLHGALTGHVDVASVVSSPIAGTWEGTMDGAGNLTGSWTEIEAVLAAAPDAGVCIPTGAPVSQPVGTGCGTWSAAP